MIISLYAGSTYIEQIEILPGPKGNIILDSILIHRFQCIYFFMLCYFINMLHYFITVSNYRKYWKT